MVQGRKYIFYIPVLASMLAVAPEHPSSRPLDAWWADLEADDFRSARALLHFSERPAEAVAYFKEKLPPLKLDTVKLKAYLLRLGSDNEKLWKGAFEDLEYFDPRLAMGLQDLMDKVTEEPARQRLVEVLSGREAGSLKDKQVQLHKFDNFYNFKADNGTWWAEARVSQINANGWGCVKRKWTRAVRAIALLEHLHTPEAVAVLKDLATGHREALPTRAAREALERLGAVSN